MYFIDHSPIRAGHQLKYRVCIDDDAGGMPAWNTQFMQGDDDDADQADFEEEGLERPTDPLPLLPSTTAEGEQEEDWLASTQGQLKRVRPENVNYAKRAKRVDVKKLKDSIWRELEEVTIKVKEVRCLLDPSSRRGGCGLLMHADSFFFARSSQRPPTSFLRRRIPRPSPK